MRARLSRGLCAAAAAAGLLLLSACSLLPASMGGSVAPQPAELQTDPRLLGVRQAWTASVGPVDFPLEVAVNGNVAVVASGDGTVAGFDATTGRQEWRGNAGGSLAAGVGFDGSTAAVVTRANELVALVSGKVVWRQQLNTLTYTPPLVAGARVFVLGGDRSITAFDGGTGRRLWTQQRTGDPLVLRQAGVILAVGDTLVVGQAGRLAGLNPLNGSVRWEATLATARGINDIERLVDLVGRVSRVGDSVCARAFQTIVGCVDTARGQLTWAQKANGGDGVSGDANAVYGTEVDGRVIAWRRSDGQRLWVNDKLLYRGVGAPLALGRSVVVGDAFGYVHLLSREDGTLLTRLATDGSAIAAAPAQAANTLVVVTRNGGVFGYVPQ